MAIARNDAMAIVVTRGNLISSRPPPGSHRMPMKLQSLPEQGYEDLGPGVRRLSPPGGDFEWIDLLAPATTNEIIDRHAQALGIPPEFFDALHVRGFESGRRRFAEATLRDEPVEARGFVALAAALCPF